MLSKHSVRTSVLVAALLAPVLFTAPAFAAVRCETQYGGAQVCIKTGALRVNKQVKVVTGKTEHEWRDYLGMSSGVRFRPGEEATFRIQVKNVGDVKFDKVTVTDTLPAFLGLSSGNLTSDLTNLDPGQTQEVFVSGKVISADRLAKAIDCAVNTAEARGKDTSGQDANDKDSVEVCYEKAVGQPTALPKAGFGDFALWVFASLLAGTSGLLLRKFAIKKSW